MFSCLLNDTFDAKKTRSFYPQLHELTKKLEPGVFWNLPWRHDCNLVSLFTTRYRVGVKGQHEFIYAILLLLLFASRNNLFYTHSFIHEKNSQSQHSWKVKPTPEKLAQKLIAIEKKTKFQILNKTDLQKGWNQNRVLLNTLKPSNPTKTRIT